MVQALGYGLCAACLVIVAVVVGRTWVDGRRTDLRIALALTASMMIPIILAQVTSADWYVVPVIGLVASIAVYVVSMQVYRRAEKYNVPGESRTKHRWFHRSKALSDVAFGLFNGLPFALFVYAVAAL